MLVTKTREKFTTIHREKFLKRVRESFWKLAIIELTKLYSDNSKSDHYSIIVLLKNLRRHHSSSGWKDKITAQELKEISASFKTQDIKDRIEKLIELRNQHYAHTDKKPDNNIYDVKFFLEDGVFLIEKAENTIKTLADKIGHPIVFANYRGEQMDEFIDKYMEARTNAAMYAMTNTKV
ncbi:MAG TPA: hypothetical protein VNY73_06505 [Bacteroidia bacterium]|nr:hypothetical protein [Bacteroidia bacterium]